MRWSKKKQPLALAVGNLHQRILCKICEELFKAAWWWAVLQLMVPERGVQQDAVARMPFENLNDLRILLANIVKGSAAPNVLHLKICSKHQEFGANVSIIVLHCHVKWIGGCEPSSSLLVGVVWFKPILHQKAIHIGTGLFQFCVVLCQHQVGFAGRLASGDLRWKNGTAWRRVGVCTVLYSSMLKHGTKP